MNNYQKYKPRAVKFSENEGYFTIHCQQIGKAWELIKERVEEDHIEGDDEREVKLSDIKPDVMYRCKDCEFMTIGENSCCECGETLESRPRQTFTYYF